MECQLKEKLAQLEAELAEPKTFLQAKDHKCEELLEKAKEATSDALSTQTELRNSRRKWVLLSRSWKTHIYVRS